MTKPSQPDTDSSTPIVLEWDSATHNIVDVRTYEVIAREVVRVDGERIVRAVNNHAMLLKALEEIAMRATAKGGSWSRALARISLVAHDAIEEVQS